MSLNRLSQILFLVLLFQESRGQELRKFSALIGPISSNTSKAFFPGWSFEPTLWLKGNISLGLRIETFDRPGIEKCNSLTVNGQYYFTDFKPNKINFFVGFGFGVYRAINEDTVLSVKVRNGVKGLLVKSVSNVDNGRLGFYPRIGFIYRATYVILEYNLIYREHLQNTYVFSTSSTATSFVLSTPFYYRSENYLGVKFGYFFQRKGRRHSEHN